MTYFNPLQALMSMGQNQNNPNPMASLMQMGKQMPPMQQPMQPINHQQFIQNTANLNKDVLANLVNQARAQGIPEPEIEKGLDFLLKLRQ